MKVLMILAAIIFHAPLLASANALTQNDKACSCDSKIQDPLEEPVRFAFGKFNGQCVDSCRFRRARILKENPTELLIGNVLHLGKYRQGRIPVRKVRNVQAGFERFAPGVDHVFLRFEFEDDISLFDQAKPKKAIASTRVLVISSEGVPPKDHKYSMTEGYQSQYLINDRIVTGEELENWTKKLKHPTRLYPLLLSPEQAAGILSRGLHRSEAASFKSAYQLFTNNCSTSALALIDGETGFKITGWNPFHWAEFEEALPLAGPIGTIHAFKTRGLISSSDFGIDLFTRAEAHP